MEGKQEGTTKPRLTLIRGGTVVTEDQALLADVLIKDNVIAAVIPAALQQEHTPPEDVTIVDATGMLVLPGGIDPHVHLEYPQGGHKIESCDDFRTGSVAAVMGGTTSMLDFVEAAPGESLMHALGERRAAAEQRSVIDFGFHMTLNRADVATLAEIPAVMDAGVSSFKIYTAYDGIRLDDAQMLAAFDALAARGGLPIVHAENHALIMHRLAAEKRQQQGNPLPPSHQPLTRPDVGEVEATQRVLALAESSGLSAGVHIVHVSAARAIPVLRRQQWLPQSALGPVTGEVTAHHLVLDDSVYNGPTEQTAQFVCAPPMRTKDDVKDMWEALSDGTLAFVVTDHCPFTSKQRLGQRRTPEFRRVLKSDGTFEVVPSPVLESPWCTSPTPSFFEMPGGVAGIETRMPLAYHYAVNVHKFPLPQFVRVTSTFAARRYGLYPQKGTLRAGADADIVVFDPHREVTITAAALHQNCDVCPFEGLHVQGWVDTVLVGGRVVVARGEATPALAAAHGRFLNRPLASFSPKL
eukprot:TRINITY_DN2553_c0_g1_i1.p1 TRINITY_DN2553_c0_g1~~TRINITY_DN2553_c0_g1_i1.p1  ORF type:complete len:524 (-),score=119.79 TRINITY_DN2553_c0_g1_i1:44-1615(-)